MERNRILFCDEKKWSVNGPDGCAYRWVHTKGPPPTAPKHPKRPSRMLWGCFSSQGSFSLYQTKTKMDAKVYCRVLSDTFKDSYQLNNAILLQDRAPPHTAKHTKNWLKAHKIRVIHIPARSPDLNPIEEIWGVLTLRVFRHVGT